MQRRASHPTKSRRRTSSLLQSQAAPAVTRGAGTSHTATSLSARGTACLNPSTQAKIKILFCYKRKNGPTKGAYDAVLTLLIYFNVALLYEATLILVANWILVSTQWICFFMSLCHRFHSFLNVLISLTNLEQDQRRGRNKCDSCNHNRLSYSWTNATAGHTSSPGNI